MDNLENFKKAALGMGYDPKEVEGFITMAAAFPKKPTPGQTATGEYNPTTDPVLQRQLILDKTTAGQPDPVLERQIALEEWKRKNPEPLSPTEKLALQEAEDKKTSAQDTKNFASQLVTDILSANTKPLTGTLRLRGAISGTDAYDTKQKVEQLKSQLSLDARSKLKGTGTISDMEMKILEKAVTALNYGMSDAAFRKELAKIQTVLSPKQLPNTPPALGTIRVRLNNGKTGTIPADKFNASLMTKL